LKYFANKDNIPNTINFGGTAESCKPFRTNNSISKLTKNKGGETMKKFNILVLLSVFMVMAVLPVSVNAGESEWAEMISGTDRDFDDVWGSSESNVFAVAARWDSEGDYTIFRYNGTAWTEMKTGSTNYSEAGIWGSSAIDIFVVTGDTILHYNGTAWTETKKDFHYLNSVWGSSGNDVFAVGMKFNLDTYQFEYAILHYDGKAWTEMINGVPSNGFEGGLRGLSSVWGSSGNDVFAVGILGTILHYNGSKWTEMSSGTSNTLNGVWGSSGNDVFAVGNFGKILHYNGSTWAEMTGNSACFYNLKVS
jgi:hypothetical protein